MLSTKSFMIKNVVLYDKTMELDPIIKRFKFGYIKKNWRSEYLRIRNPKTGEIVEKITEMESDV